MNNLTMFTDFYALTMMQGYFTSGMNRTAVFDLFYRKNPCGGGFGIFAGLDTVLEYLSGLRFTDEDVKYLEGLNRFSPEFLNYLREFRFTGDIAAIAEGSVVFPGEPLLRVTAPLPEAQLLEGALLNILNHQSLIATKSARVCLAAGDDPVLEFGLRRAQGPDAGLYGSRAAVIGGCAATSNVLAGRVFDLNLRGTHAHSWIMSFNSEFDAFSRYANVFPDSSGCTLLVDTYDTLKSGLPNAIKVFRELAERGVDKRKLGIRLDSGDLAYLSKMARDMLDQAGFPEATISASSDLDEYLIQSLKLQGAKIDIWGVGTNLITSSDWPALGGVYKIAAIQQEDGSFLPKIKLSETPEKITNPGIKRLVRFYDTNGMMKADLICLADEELDINRPLVLFDPLATWKRMTLRPGEFQIREMLIDVVKAGKIVYKSPSVSEIKTFRRNEINSLWDEYKRFMNPHVMPVDLSAGLYDLKQRMIIEARGE